ncbi:hypothetical protein QY049_02760 [Bradyrhizobium sp. WYCCWR 13022]|nr:hypothetical protein [Bradyrhizobium sp. WYCCWR 13022]MDN4982145.1 hypothetical protein [Bradyrhizobium sp. WYCCWR 13022]
MADRPASWRMPTPKQMQKMAAAVGKSTLPSPGLAPDAALPPEYWKALLEDPAPEGADQRLRASIGAQRLDQIPSHLLRVGCRRCGRTVEVQKVDAVRLYGPEALWKAVGQRLLDNTCPSRSGHNEEDGCWPTFE